MAAAQHPTDVPQPLRLVQDGDARPRAIWEQLPLPAQRLFLVAPISWGWRAAGPILVVLLGGHVEPRKRTCSAHGPWVCCARHRRQYRETYGCRDCRADLLSWRPRPAAARKARKPYSLGTTFTRRDAAESKALGIHRLPVLPATYGECLNTPRPCLFFRCRHNLWLDVHPESGAIKLNFPGLDPHEVEHTCSIDAALDGATSAEPEDRVMHTLEQIGEWMNMTTVRAGQLVTDALGEAKAKVGEPEMTDRGTDEVDEFSDEPTTHDLSENEEEID